MLIPSEEEIRQAVHSANQDGPMPLAELVDTVPSIHAMVSDMAGIAKRQGSNLNLYTFLKSAFVAGLNLGIRIGEARARYFGKPN
jgi:hypothetical protein